MHSSERVRLPHGVTSAGAIAVHVQCFVVVISADTVGVGVYSLNVRRSSYRRLRPG